MNGGPPQRRQNGFTIVEVLIVLAVTGGLLIGAMLLISGKQNITAFNQSIRNAQTQLQEIVNDVGSGTYQTNNTLTCDKGGPSGGLLLGSGAKAQGTNANCIFIGKVIQFAVHGTDPEQFNVYTLAGLRGDSVNPSTDLATAKARVIAKGTVATDATVPDAFQAKNLMYGLTVIKMYYNNTAANAIGAVGFTSNVTSLGNGDGSQRVNVVAITGTSLQVDKATAVNQINTNIGAGLVNPPNGVQICLKSGGTAQSGLISIGGSDRQGSVDLQIYNNGDCTP